MIEFVLGGLLLIALWTMYSCYYRPKNYINRQAQRLRDLGYSVYQTPYRPFQVSFIKLFEKDLKDHGDTFYTYKTKHPKMDIAIQYIFNKVSIVLINPDLFKDLFTPDKVAIYPKYDMLDGIKQLLGEGIAFSEGAKWKHKRKVISNAFNFDLLKQNITKISNICDRNIAQFEQLYKIKDGQFSYNLITLGNRIFNGIMMACFFGSDEVKEKIKNQNFDAFLVRLMNDANQLSFSPLVALIGKKAFAFGGITPKIRQILERIKIFKTIASNIIAKRTQEVSKKITSQKCSDLIENLIKEQQRQKQNGISQPQYTSKDVLQQFCTFIIAGTDTTSHFFMMMVYYILQRPQIEQKLREDIDQVIKGEEDYNYQNLKKLTYIDWIQLETTRYYGPGTGIFLRQATQDNYIGKIPIRKGTILTINPIGNHYSEEYFKNPEQFRPQRWKQQCNNLKPYALTGFSGGPRACIGKQLALLQSKIAMIKLFKRYDKMVIPKEKMIMENKFLYYPKPFKTTFIRKN